MVIISKRSSLVSYLRRPSDQHHVIFILLTALFLWIPIRFQGFFPVTLEPFVIYALALLLTVRYYLSLGDGEKIINLLSYGMFLFGLWVVISAGMHYWAFNSLELEAYVFPWNIKEIRTDKHWAIWTLSFITTTYLIFLSLFLVAIVIFRSTDSGWKMLTWIPLIFIPCVLVALYQFYVNVDFLNNKPSYHPDFNPLGGLGTDMTAFRISLFLIFPLCVFTVIIAQAWWKKILYVSIAAVILWLVWLSEGRSVSLGVILFTAAIPLVGIWVHGFRSNKGRRYLYVALVWILALGIITGIVFFKFGLFPERLRDSFSHALHGDLIKADPMRIDMMRQAWRLIKLSPISGWGPGGFLRNADKIRFVNGDPPVKPQYSGSLYLVWGTDIGLLGASVILCLYVMPIWMILRVRKRVQIREERWAVGIIFAALAIMFLLFIISPYTYFPEVQWIFLVYLGFLISVALKHGCSFYPIKGWGWGAGALLLTIVFIVGVYGTTFGSHGYEAIYRDILFQPDGQWKSRTGEKAGDAIKTAVATVQASSNIFSIKVSTVAQNNRLLEAVRLKIFMNNELLDDRYFFKSLENTLYYYVPSIENKNVEIKTEIHPVFKPYRSDDANIQMTVGPPSFIRNFPQGDIGFYPGWGKKTVGWRYHPGLPKEPVVFDYRLTGMRATLTITDSLRKRGIIYAQSTNPYLKHKPVSVDIIGDEGLIQREWFWHNRWKKIKIMPNRFERTKTLTFQVSRIWNPMLSAVSRDSNDHGIVVAYPDFEIQDLLIDNLIPVGI